VPSLRTFGADVIFLSTGLDSHYDDLYHYLTEDDLHWLTLQIVHEASLPHTQIISILEGGYSLEPTHTNTPTAVAGEQEILGAGTGSGVGSGTGAPLPSTAQPGRGGKGGVSGKYGIRPGDGGLVKGTLAHVAALAGR
jgi:hypothetical protein